MKNEHLRAMRKRRGLTQEDLAARTGIAVETISRLENDRECPRSSTVRVLCLALEATPEELGYNHVGW